MAKKYFFLLFLPLICMQCSQQAYQGTRGTSLKSKEIQADNFSGSVEDRLAHLLRRESGVIVTPANNSYVVRIRGLSNSFVSSSGPLFVINGVSLGHDFRFAAESIAGNSIRSIRVLKGQDASFYGTRGSGGVIVVKTQ